MSVHVAESQTFHLPTVSRMRTKVDTHELSHLVHPLVILSPQFLSVLECRDGESLTL